MRGTCFLLAIMLSLASRPALARPEPPSREDQPAGESRNDSPEPSGPSYSGSSSGSETGPSYSGYSSGGDTGYDSSDARGSAHVSHPSSDRNHERYAGEAPDAGRDHPGRAHSHGARSAGESGGQSLSTSPAGGEVTAGSTPPGARLRDPDSAPPTDAQQRHPRPHESGYPGGSPTDSDLTYYYDDGSLSASYYLPFDLGGRGGYSPDYFRNRSRRGGALRLLIDPGQTGVYVDGYYVGTADSFQSTGQRLFLSPGRHEIMLVLDGYYTRRFELELSADAVFDLRRVMEPVGPPQD